jgi:YjbE family integral membrane protein
LVTDFTLNLPALSALFQVILIDVALSGDNAIVIALAASGLPAEQRKTAIAIGIGAAIALRVLFAISAVFLLELPGLLMVGGLMLGWVCVKMWRELRQESEDEAHHVSHKAKTLRDAVLQITFADVSMSLDNVLAVSGAAREHIFVMAAGLVLAIVMMAFAANAIAPLLRRWRWLNYAGLALIAFVAVKMVVEGAGVSNALRASLLP